jgi:hypothetical protein
MYSGDGGPGMGGGGIGKAVIFVALLSAFDLSTLQLPECLNVYHSIQTLAPILLLL